MSDSFADLWNSSAPTKPVPQPQKLGSAITKNALKPAQPDVFSLLSSAGSSNISSRSISPVVSGGTSQRTAQSPATKSLSNSSDDAFSSLFSGSLATSTNDKARMTMAEKVAEAGRQKLEKLSGHEQMIKSQPTSNVWDGLDSLAIISAQPVPSSSKSKQALPIDDWDLNALTSQPASCAESTSSPASIVTTENDWLGEFANRPASQLEPQTTGLSNQIKSPSLPRRHGDFDFGSRVFGGDSNSEDNILGVLGKPVDALPERRSLLSQDDSTLPASSPPIEKTPSSRSVSPPPHILGQIVEMGFSVQQARIALAATGLDVQAALETLLADGIASGTPPAQSSIRSSDCHPAPRSASRLASCDHERSTTSPANSQQDIREQTDKLLTHASEIGMNVLNMASSFWKEGKERVHKAYVEHTVTATGSSSGRPRWMTEQMSHINGDEAPRKKISVGPGVRFFDEVEPQPKQEKAPEIQLRPTDLSSDNSQSIAYISPFRRRIPADISASRATSTSTPDPVRPPSPLRPQVKLVSASPSMLATAYKHKEAGSAKFKLGQYVEAEGIYSFGIDALPSGHLLLLPLYNNRALARLRNGDYTGAIADAGAVIDLIGTRYNPQREAKVAREEEGAGVDLGDALVKALKRRAEAYEGREKWEEAAKDWSTLTGLEWAEQKTRGEAARSVGRCRKMVAPTKEAGITISKSSTSEPNSKMAVNPASLSRPAVPSQALENLRILNHAVEAEDQLRHELKDSVDAKLLAWKGGKETNIRALLGSLDTVLWPELGLQKVGMAELVMPTQVKNKYTRTIAKLHPDKVSHLRVSTYVHTHIPYS
ncbi:hypothetical protein C0992_004029 [Termitomyces sp. T32_za158]|nr:hypothetical protein C0992_004029 [Termitomyces sp. T32_za158]